MYYLCSENKGAEQLRGYCEADLRLFFAYAKSQFSHDTAHTVDGSLDRPGFCEKFRDSFSIFLFKRYVV